MKACLPTKPMYCSREYFKTSRLIQQYEKPTSNRPKLIRGSAGIRCKKPQPVADINISVGKSHKTPTVQKVTKDSMDFPVPKPFYPDLIYRPPPRPPDNLRPNHPKSESDTPPKIDAEFEENSPHQEGIILEYYQRPDKS